MVEATVFFHKDFTDIPQGKLNVKETLLFRAIISQINHKGTEIVEITFDTLRDLLTYKDEAILPLSDVAKCMYKKLNDITLPPSLSETEEKFRLFDIFEISEDNSSVKIQISRRFAYLFNNPFFFINQTGELS